MATIEEVHSEREKNNQEYIELCERLTQEQDEKEISRIQRLIELNRYNERSLKFKELRVKLLNVKDNKERNEVINAYVEETKGEVEERKQAIKREKMEMQENWKKHLEEKKQQTAERKRLAEENKKQIAERKKLAKAEKLRLAEQKKTN